MNSFMNMIKNAATALTLLAGIILTASCEHKPLYLLDNNPRPVRMEFNWQNLRPGDDIPEGMRLYLNNEGEKPLWYDVPTNTGLTTNLVPGDYVITGGSNDIPSVNITQNGDDVVISQQEPNTQVPPIYGIEEKVLIENGAPEGEEPETQVVTLKPYALNCIYNVRVINTDVVKDADVWTASLSGLTDAILLSTGKSAPEANEIKVPFGLKDAGNNERNSTLSVLGQYPGATNELIVSIKRKDGSTVYYKLDVTPQINNATDFRNLEIIADLSKLQPYDDGGKGSITPEVDPYPEINIGITM